MDEVQLPRLMKCAASPEPLRIAVVYSRLPFPMMRGDQMTVAHLLSFLAARGHSVDLYTLAVDGDLTGEQSSWLQRNCRTVRIYEQSWAAKLLGLVLGILSLLPLQVSIFRNTKLRRELAASVAAGSTTSSTATTRAPRRPSPFDPVDAEHGFVSGVAAFADAEYEADGAQ